MAWLATEPALFFHLAPCPPSYFLHSSLRKAGSAPDAVDAHLRAGGSRTPAKGHPSLRCSRLVTRRRWMLCSFRHGGIGRRFGCGATRRAAESADTSAHSQNFSAVAVLAGLESPAHKETCCFGADVPGWSAGACSRLRLHSLLCALKPKMNCTLAAEQAPPNKAQASLRTPRRSRARSSRLRPPLSFGGARTVGAPAHKETCCFGAGVPVWSAGACSRLRLHSLLCALKPKMNCTLAAEQVPPNKAQASLRTPRRSRARSSRLRHPISFGRVRGTGKPRPQRAQCLNVSF